MEDLNSIVVQNVDSFSRNVYNSVRINGDAHNLANSMQFYMNDKNNLDLIASNGGDGIVNIVGTMNSYKRGVINLIASPNTDTGVINIIGKEINIDGKISANGINMKNLLYIYTVTLQPNVEENLDFLAGKTVNSFKINANAAGSITINDIAYEFGTDDTNIEIDETKLESLRLTSTVACNVDIPLYSS